MIGISVPLTFASWLRRGGAGQAAVIPPPTAVGTATVTPVAGGATPLVSPPLVIEQSPTAFLALPAAMRAGELGRSPTPTLPPQGQVKVRGLRLRAGPGTGWVVRGYLEKDDILEITGRNADSTWLKVRTAEGQEGWTSALYVETQFPLSVLPVATAIP